MCHHNWTMQYHIPSERSVILMYLVPLLLVANLCSQHQKIPQYVFDHRQNRNHRSLEACPLPRRNSCSQKAHTPDHDKETSPVAVKGLGSAHET